jgi:hypothetical protein
MVGFVMEVVVLMVHMSDELTACLIRGNQIKSKKYHSVETISKSNNKIVERGIIDIRSTHIHETGDGIRCHEMVSVYVAYYCTLHWH